MSDTATKWVRDLLAKSDELCETAKTAERNGCSLDGDNYYGNRFHKQLADFASLETPFFSLLKAAGEMETTADELHACLDAITATSRQGKRRCDALRQLRILCNGSVLPALTAGTLPPNPIGEPVIPKAVVIPSKDTYLINVVIQANACFEARCYDAASVMIRKLVESLIIAVYEAHGRAADIKNGSGDFLMLSDLIQKVLADSAWNLGRETKTSLPKLKALGDRSAHNRRYLATKADVDAVIPGLRVVVDDLLHLAKLK